MAEIINVNKIVRHENVKDDLSGKNCRKKTLIDNVLTIFKTKKSFELKSNNLVDNTEKDLDAGCKNNDFKKSNFITRFFKIKQAKSVFVVLIVAIIALLILSKPISLKGVGGSSVNSNLGYMTGLDYCNQLENKLVDVLGCINGVGEISVMVTVESSPEIKLATSTDERTNTTNNGSGVVTNNTVVSDPVIIGSSGQNNPIVLSEMSPQITGVIVVAKGAKDVKVRLNLLQAVEALLNVPTENIQIYY